MSINRDRSHRNRLKRCILASMFLKMLVYLQIAKMEMSRTLTIKLKINIRHNSSLSRAKIINTHILCRILVRGNGTRMEVIMIICSKQSFREWVLDKFKVVKITIIKHKGLGCHQLMEYQNRIKWFQRKNGVIKTSIQRKV